MDARQQRGLAIAQSLPLRGKKGLWGVPSQSGKAPYLVDPHPESPRCTCPDYEMRGMKCKHIFAVEFTVKARQNRDGSTTITRTVTVTDTIKKPTYPQDWPAYNAAQTHEKDEFLSLLHALCAGIPEPTAAKGRPRIPLADAVFAAML